MKKGKTSTSSSYKRATVFEQADKALRQIRMENAVKDLAKSNKRMGIITPRTTSTTSTSTPRANKTIKSKK